jgi:hypothetical protein
MLLHLHLFLNNSIQIASSASTAQGLPIINGPNLPGIPLKQGGLLWIEVFQGISQILGESAAFFPCKLYSAFPIVISKNIQSFENHKGIQEQNNVKVIHTQSPHTGNCY